MDRLRTVVGQRSRSVVVLAVYAAIVGGTSFVVDVGAALDGDVPAIGRATLGLMGAIGAWMVWTGTRVGIDGWRLCLMWAVLQIPVIAWNTHGSPTTQIVHIPLALTSRTTVNDHVTSYSEIGVNLVGIALAAWLSRGKARPLQRSPIGDEGAFTRTSFLAD